MKIMHDSIFNDRRSVCLTLRICLHTYIILWSVQEFIPPFVVLSCDGGNKKKSMYLTPPHIYSWTPSHCKSKYRYDMVLILQLWSCKICPCIFNTRIFKICFCHLNYIANLKPWFLFF